MYYKLKPSQYLKWTYWKSYNTFCFVCSKLKVYLFKS